MKKLDILIDAAIYALYMFLSCLVCMFAEMLIIKVVLLCYDASLFTVSLIRAVVYTLGVCAILSVCAFKEGYRMSKMSLGGTFISAALASLIHFMFSLLFSFEAFCSGGVKSISMLFKFGNKLTEKSFAGELHSADCIAVFFAAALLYCILITAFKKYGAKKRFIDRNDLTNS